MKHFRLRILKYGLAGLLLVPLGLNAQIAKGANKFLGNITTGGQVRSDYMTYWNQITGENEHKWSSIENTRDLMNWTGGDRIANFAKQNNIPWKFHTLVWGSQYPSWMNNLSVAEQKEEIIEWFDEVKAHYPEIPLIDVVNEAYMSDPSNWNAGKHAPVPFRDALGGTGETGFDWIVTSFKMARERWPEAILIYNDYNTLEWGSEINWIKQIIPKLVAAGAPIDAVGFQAHGLKGTSAATLQARLDDIYKSIQLPMYITEYDIGDNNDQSQLDNYKAHITVMWNHPKIVGITIWGYILGSTWVEGTGIINNGKERPAMTWLKEFIEANPNPPNDYPNLTAGSGSSTYKLTVNTKGLGDISSEPNENRFEKDSKVSLTAKAQDGWVFDSWSGDASGNQNPLQIVMDGPKDITAKFKTVDGRVDLITDGSFASDNGSWEFNNWSGTGFGTIEKGEYKITVSEVAENYYDIQAVQPGITLEEGKSYSLTFEAYSSAARSLYVNVGMPEDPYTSFLTDVVDGEKVVNLTTEKQKFTISFVMKEPSYKNSRVEFSAGLENATVYIDNVSLHEIEGSHVSPSPVKRNNNRFSVQQCGAFLKISFDMNDNGNLSVDIHDLKGKVVKSAKLNKQFGVVQNFTISTNGMSKGYYIVKVKSENSVKKSGFVFSGR